MYKHTVPNSYGHGSTLLFRHENLQKTLTSTLVRLFGNRTSSSLFVCAAPIHPDHLRLRARARSAALCMDKPAGTFF